MSSDEERAEVTFRKWRNKVISGGRISLPKELRDEMGIKEGTFYEIEEIDLDTISIRFFKV